MNNVFLPKKISVGYVKRGGTYTGKLAYIIYTDEKGVLRKETSWQGWRDKKINPDEFNNEPTSGFVLNKRVGGYSTGWNHRQTYTRVYDPRGFEFEITVENLLYILENSNSIKGKGLEGEFVYGWEGTELLLIPVDSPDYKEMLNYSNSRFDFDVNKVKAKDLIFGATYRNKQNEDLIYLGRFDEHSDYYWCDVTIKPNMYFFKTVKSGRDTSYVTYKSPSVLIGLKDATPVDNYAELMSDLESSPLFSPIDKNGDKMLLLTDEELIEKAINDYSVEVYFNVNGIKHVATLYPINEDDDDEDYDENYNDNENIDYLTKKYEIYGPRLVGGNSYDYIQLKSIKEGTLSELNKFYNFTYKQQYLKNGNKKR